MRDYQKEKLRRGGGKYWLKQWLPTPKPQEDPAPALFECYNVEDGQVEGRERMTLAEATERNAELRSHLQPQRWIRQTEPEDL